jgi:hypothetical protein
MFLDNGDRHDFLRTLAEACQKTGSFGYYLSALEREPLADEAQEWPGQTGDCETVAPGNDPLN